MRGDCVCGGQSHTVFVEITKQVLIQTKPGYWNMHSRETAWMKTE